MGGPTHVSRRHKLGSVSSQQKTVGKIESTAQEEAWGIYQYESGMSFTSYPNSPKFVKLTWKLWGL